MVEWCHLLVSRTRNEWSFRCLLLWMRRSVVWIVWCDMNREMGGQEAKEKSPRRCDTLCTLSSKPLSFSLNWHVLYFIHFLGGGIGMDNVNFFTQIMLKASDICSELSARTHLQMGERWRRHLAVFVWYCYKPPNTSPPCTHLIITDGASAHSHRWAKQPLQLTEMTEGIFTLCVPTTHYVLPPTRLSVHWVYKTFARAS